MMSHDYDVERAVLGALALKPDLIKGCPVRAYDFPPGRYRETFSVLTKMWEEERPKEIDPLLLANQIGGEGVHEFVGSLFNGSIKLDHAQFSRRVTELRKRRLASRIKSAILEQTKIGELDLDEIRADLNEYDSLQDERSFDPAKVLITGTALQALDLQVGYVVDKIAPDRSITLVHGPGGLAKTWLALGMSKSVSEGKPFLGLETKQRMVTYVDYENPLPMLIERVRKLDIREARFWHLSASTRPPKLDSDDWTLLKSLQSGFIIIDTARSSFDGDENSSQDVALVMNRLKELRELDNEVILLHHTPRANERAAKGSTAWEDLADHVLSFYKVKRETLEASDEEAVFDPSALLSLGTGRKTRYEPFRMYLTLDPENGGFRQDQSPDITAIDALAEYVAGPGLGKNQGEILAWAKEAGVGPRKRPSLIALLNRGEQLGRWTTRRAFKGAKIYEPAG